MTPAVGDAARDYRPEAATAGSLHGDGVVRLLCAVLRGDPEGQTPAAVRAVDSLVAELRRPLLRYCEGLVRQGRGEGRSAPLATDRRIDAEDLAQEAWTKSLRYLAGVGGARVGDVEHLRRLLRCAAKTIFLDRVTKGSAPAQIVELDAPLRNATSGGVTESRTNLGDSLASNHRGGPPEGGATDLIFLQDERWVPLLECLFRNEAEFHRTYRRKHQRRPRQYQAFVLYQLGVFFRSEVVDDGDEERPSAGIVGDLIGRYVELLGISPAQWIPVARAALSLRSPADRGNLAASVGAGEAPGDPVDGLDSEIAAAVNTVCGTNIKASNMLAVLRYELNQFVSDSKVREKEGAPAGRR